MLVSITTNYFLFAVDTKIFNEVFSKADTGDHQSDIDRLEEWANTCYALLLTHLMC